MSLELNLFFGRIMKEHMIFMETGFLVKNSNFILEADQLCLAITKCNFRKSKVQDQHQYLIH